MRKNQGRFSASGRSYPSEGAALSAAQTFVCMRHQDEVYVRELGRLAPLFRVERRGNSVYTFDLR